MAEIDKILEKIIS